MKLSIRTLETLDVMPEDHKPKHEHIAVSPLELEEIGKEF